MDPYDKGNDFIEPYQPNKNSGIRNAGFRVGIVCGLVFGGLHLLLVIVLKTPFSAVFIVLWLIQFVVYYLAGRNAAEKQYETQKDNVDALNGVQGAGSGAGLVMSLTTWVFIFMGALIQDALGRFVFVEPVSLCIVIFVDVSLGLGLGSLAGKQIVHQYKVFDV